MIVACDLSVVNIYCDGLSYGACENRKGIRYVDGIPLCPIHAS